MRGRPADRNTEKAGGDQDLQVAPVEGAPIEPQPDDVGNHIDRQQKPGRDDGRDLERHHRHRQSADRGQAPLGQADGERRKDGDDDVGERLAEEIHRVSGRRSECATVAILIRAQPQRPTPA